MVTTPSEPSVVHPPLSVRLTEILGEHERESLSLNELLAETEGRGIYLVMILLNLPFLTPIPVPGLSPVLGSVLLFIGLQIVGRRRPKLPNFLGERRLPAPKMRKILAASIRLLRFLERWVKPRKSDWMTCRTSCILHGSVLSLMAVMLLLPIPPVVPASNMLPGYSIILVAASMMEEDGVMIFAGYLVAAITVVYFTFAASMITDGVLKMIDKIF